MSKPSVDRFEAIRQATLKHRAAHGCGAYPYSNGALLAALAAAANARRILELGTALGYTALCFAHGAPHAVVDTIERDPDHVLLARENVTKSGLDGHVVVHEGEFAEVLSRLDPGFDIAFFDGFAPSPAMQKTLRQVLRAGGILISANLTHDGKPVEAYRAGLLDKKKWLTAFVDAEGETAISIKR
jgi:predicted O-methyltransferase YrrM